LSTLHDFFGTSGDSTPPEGQVEPSNLSGFGGTPGDLFSALVSSHKAESGDYWLSS
jgi:hypothetical protein